jgi:protein-disulfide isomerase
MLAAGKSSRIADRLLNVLVVLSTAGALGAVWFRWQRSKPPGLPSMRNVSGWRSIAAGGSNVSGPMNAPVVLTVFTDFQCPYCKRSARSVDSVLRAYPVDVRLVVRHLPISRIHPGAVGAAKAAICAGRQGRLLEMHDALYLNSDSLASGRWADLAREAGVTDSLAFTNCLSSGPTDAQLRSDSVAAQSVGARGTPTILVNETLIPFAPTRQILDSLIRDKLQVSSKNPRQP